MIVEITGEASMKEYGARIGAMLAGGEVIELIGDVGSGKTVLTKGMAAGMDIDEDVQSPSFTISRVYESPRNLKLAHYDFYRLEDAGIMEDELNETVHEQDTITVIEWAGIVADILPEDRIVIRFISPSETTRRLEVNATGPVSRALIERLI
jgi:tRNA threonylcarbamoyladenosine biosynthesis protein TsaE